MATWLGSGGPYMTHTETVSLSFHLNPEYASAVLFNPRNSSSVSFAWDWGDTVTVNFHLYVMHELGGK